MSVSMVNAPPSKAATNSKRFYRRPRLDSIGHHTITRRFSVEVCATIGVEHRVVGHCQYFTGPGINRDRSAGLSACFNHGALQLTMLEGLQP